MAAAQQDQALLRPEIADIRGSFRLKSKRCRLSRTDGLVEFFKLQWHGRFLASKEVCFSVSATDAKPEFSSHYPAILALIESAFSCLQYRQAGFLQGLLQVPNDVIRILNAHREAEKSIVELLRVQILALIVFAQEHDEAFVMPQGNR